MTSSVIRLLVAALFVYQASAMVIPGNAAAQRFDGVTLRVATYGGPWKDGMQALIGAEMEKLGGKIEFLPVRRVRISRN